MAKKKRTIRQAALAVRAGMLLSPNERLRVCFNSTHELVIHWDGGSQLAVRSLYGHIHVSPTAANEVLIS